MRKYYNCIAINGAAFFKKWGTWGSDGIKRNKHAILFSNSSRGPFTTKLSGYIPLLGSTLAVAALQCCSCKIDSMKVKN